jgi:hypothetical protein
MQPNCTPGRHFQDYQLPGSQPPAAAISLQFHTSRKEREKWGTRFRYTFRIVKTVLPTVFVILMVAALGFAEETSFRRVKVPNLNGKQIKAVLTFSDNDKAVEVRPVKGAPVTIPYSQIDKCNYEYTNALMGEKSLWLEIDYHEQDAHKVLVLLMDKHNYIRILDALKSHTGIDAEIVGNAKKR